MSDVYNEIARTMNTNTNNAVNTATLTNGLVLGILTETGLLLDNFKHEFTDYLVLDYLKLNDSYRSLKELELFMGENIKESSVPFDLNRYPTKTEIDELITYCLHDVKMTFKVFEQVYYRYEAQLGLIEYFDLEESNDYKTFISSSISFLKKDKEFTKLLSSNDKAEGCTGGIFQ